MSSADILIGAMIGLVAIVALVIAFSWVFARLWCKPKREPPTRTPADYELPFESVSYSSHGVPVRGWFVPGESDASLHPVVILAHGWSRNGAEMLPLASLLHEAGFAVLLYDSRGHGLSGEDGPITIRKFAEDIISTTEYLQTRPDVDKGRLGVVGRSIGGAAAILAASAEPRIRAIASCSAFADPQVLTRNQLARMHIPTWPVTWLVCRFIERWLGTTMDKVTPQNRIGQIKGSLLLIHGDTDQFTSPSNMEALYERAPRERTERLLIPGRGHSDVMRDTRCGQRIVAFFCRTLLPIKQGAVTAQCGAVDCWISEGGKA
jgi:dipeptidyl aminopeptidase/acylaminoacyl peptidase